MHADGRRSRDDATVPLLLEQGPRSLGDGVRPLQVRVVHGVPLLFRHRSKRLVAQDAGVANDGVQAAEPVERGLDELVAFEGRSDDGDGFASGCARAREGWSVCCLGNRERRPHPS